MNQRALIAVVVVAACVAVVSMFEFKRPNKERGADTSHAVERVATPDPRGIHVVVRDRNGQLARSFVQFGPYRRGEHQHALLSSQVGSYAHAGETWLPRPTEPTIVRAAFDGQCEEGLLLHGSSRTALLDPDHLPDVLTLEVDDLTRVDFLVSDAISPDGDLEIEDEFGLIEAATKVGGLRLPSLSLPRGSYTARLVQPSGVTLCERPIVVGADPAWLVLAP